LNRVRAAKTGDGRFTLNHIAVQSEGEMRGISGAGGEGREQANQGDCVESNELMRNDFHGVRELNVKWKSAVQG
jgi:hypothetical protein